MTNTEALLFVGKCLSLATEPNSVDEIQKRIQSSRIDWGLVVYESSNQLVVPALYLNLKRNKLLSDLPEDLISYFEEITNANCERNQQILSQVKNITALLNKAGLSPIFLKGTAHLIDGLYQDIGERMIGDIDFILKMEDALKAFQILKDNGYHPLYGYGEPKLGKSRHFPRLVDDNEIAGVEVHGRMLNGKPAQNFGWDQVFPTCKQATNLSGAFVLSDSNLILSNALNVQLNDKGNKRYKTFLRQSYDLLLLSKRANPLAVSKAFIPYFEIINNYLSFSAYLFGYPQILPFEKNKLAKRYLKRMEMIWKYPKLARMGRLVSFLFFRLYRYISTVLMLFFSASTRKRVFTSLADSTYYRKHFEQYKNI
ncbi:MAG: nucleotidyltransferase family protein [Bacteroidales bacterium]|nr:nucleotidyltransferase family protein [Bacteroidales bacterium]